MEDCSIDGTPSVRRRIHADLYSHSGSGSSSSQQSDDVQFDSVFEKLPVEIVHHIHSFLPVRDAARAACVSHEFLRSWRRYPNLTLDAATLGVTSMKSEDQKTILIDIVDRILHKHSGNGVEIFKLELGQKMDASYPERWLQLVARSGIKKLSIVMPFCTYNFPCAVLSDEGAAGSVERLRLQACHFRPTPALGRLKRLTRLQLYSVHITDGGLAHLLSTCFALEQMDIDSCDNIICLSIPRTLHKLRILSVLFCHKLQAIYINAPQLSTFHCVETTVENISVEGPSQLKDMNLSLFRSSRMLSLSLARLPAMAPNVESLALFSRGENIDTPMLISKFSCLKKLEINFGRSQPLFDVLSLVSILEALPSLASFILHVGEDALGHDDSVVGGDNANNVRCKPQGQHDHLRRVEITGFCSARNMIQFVIYFLESAPSLESLTLDTTSSFPRYFDIVGKKEGCSRMSESRRADAHRAVKAAERYIVERVPSGVKFKVVEPCSCCRIN